jgi:hypothetical protein
MSDTYQSRVFSFISKRTNRLKDSCAKGLRHLKIAVVWTGQALWYPLHLLAHTAKFLTHQLPATAPKALPQLPPELNIEQALAIVADAGCEIEIANRQPIVVDDWSYIDDEIWQTGHGNAAVASRELTYQPRSIDRQQTTKPIVRGLSSLLSDRSIVLVTTENEILDLLNIFQQQEIRRRIGIDLAIGWHQWQQQHLQYRRIDNLPWQRSELLLESTDSQYLSLLPESKTTLDSERATLFDRFQNWLDSFKPQAEDRSMFNIDTPAPNTERIPPQLTAFSYPFTPQPPRIVRPIPQRERYANELPQLPPVAEESTALVPARTDNYPARLAPTWLKNWWNYYRDYLYIRTPPEGQIVDRLSPSEFQLIPLNPPSARTSIVRLADRSTSKIAKPKFTSTVDSRSDRQPEFNPEWLDIESEDLGHSNSIVRRILMWLDSLMLVIENWLIKVWEFITNKVVNN